MEKIIKEVENKFKNFYTIKFLIDKYIEYIKQIFEKQKIQTFEGQKENGFNIENAIEYFKKLGEFESSEEAKKEFGKILPDEENLLKDIDINRKDMINEKITNFSVTAGHSFSLC